MEWKTWARASCFGWWGLQEILSSVNPLRVPVAFHSNLGAMILLHAISHACLITMRDRPGKWWTRRPGAVLSPRAPKTGHRRRSRPQPNPFASETLRCHCACGAMDSASDFESGGCGFESRQAFFFFFYLCLLAPIALSTFRGFMIVFVLALWCSLGHWSSGMILL